MSVYRLEWFRYLGLARRYHLRLCPRAVVEGPAPCPRPFNAFVESSISSRNPMFVGHGTSSFDENEDLLGNQPGVPSSPPPQPQQLVLRAPSIVAFALWHVATPTAWLHEPGRLYCGGCAGHHRASGSQTAAMFPDTLGVGIVRQHPRDNGCERQVLVHFTRAVSRVEGRLSLCSGRLQLFLSHWPSTTGACGSGKLHPVLSVCALRDSLRFSIARLAREKRT